MKFSDMMGKGAKTDAPSDDPTDTVTPPARVKAPPVAEAPIRFAAPPPPPAPVDAAPVAPAPVASPLVPPAPAEPPAVAATAPDAGSAPPAILDVMAELAPRRSEASERELDASAWLDDLTAIDDDLLPS